MKIAKKHSHQNGEEWLLVHRKAAYEEILQAIESVDAEACRTKISQEKRSQGAHFFSPRCLNLAIDARLRSLGWKSERHDYYIAHNEDQYSVMEDMGPADQKQFLEREGMPTIFSYNQTDHVKEGIAIEVQFGKYAFVAYDLFVKHMAFYAARRIFVGIEILPTKAIQQQMSSGIAYYEGELHNILRSGRTNPAVPLLILGVEP